MTVDYNPAYPEVRRDPYPYYAALRKDAPVYQIPGTEMYAVSRYDDVALLLKQPNLFSSSGMRMMLTQGLVGAAAGGQATGVAALLAGSGAAPQVPAITPADAIQLIQSLPFDLGALMSSRSLIMADPPVHTPLRGLVNRGFTPRRIAALEPRIREIAAECAASMRDRDRLDLVEELTIPLPVRVIAELLGVEADRQADFKRWSDTIISNVSGGRVGAGVAEMLGVFKELVAYLTEIIEARKAAPKDDLISVLVAAQDAEVGLTDLELVMFAILLLAAGNETTTNLVGNAVIALLERPDQLRKVRGRPDLIPSLVEEALRFDSPVQALFRQVTEDTEFAGTKLAEGAIVLPLFAAANRDDTVFPAADEFDVLRNPQGHLAFGFGVHFCLGASLARLEARIALETLLCELPEFETTAGEIERIDSFLLRGPRRLPIAWT